MRVALTQMDIVWENKEKNMQKVMKLVEEAKKQKVELIVFPEMTLTGFTMNTKLAGEELLFSPTVAFFKKLSKQYNLAIAFGFVEDFGNEYYNKLIIVSNGKIIYDYDKIHPFNYGEEGKHYTGGTELNTAMLGQMHISGFVCYDLRFPEIFQVVSKIAEMIIVIANWPKVRIAHWETLLRARAIENQCYIVGVNRTGIGNGLEYTESSMVFDPFGEKLTQESKNQELLIVEIDANRVREVREQYPFKRDRKPDFYKDFY